MGAASATPTEAGIAPPPNSYWLTRFVLLRWMGFVYVIAFYVAARQLVPLVGEHGLTPAPLYLQEVRAYLGHKEALAQPGTGEHLVSAWRGFLEQPSLFWLDCSDIMLRGVAWTGVVLSFALLAGYTNAIILTILWVFYLSIVVVGQTWYGYGWEIQMSETGFLCIFLCPLLDLRPFPARPPPVAIIWLFRWLIFRIMLGSALIKWRGDASWHDLTALYYHFETQPIPNPFSRWFNFLPHPVLQFGVIWTFIVEGLAPFFCFWPRWGRYIAGGIMISFQLTLIVSGNLSFFNWLTILPALACFDDRFWRWLLPTWLKSLAMEAQLAARPSCIMTGVTWAIAGLVALLSIHPVLNLIAPGEAGQAMNTTYDSLHLVNTYGAFGSVGQERPVIILKATTATTRKQKRAGRNIPMSARLGTPHGGLLLSRPTNRILTGNFGSPPWPRRRITRGSGTSTGS